MNFVQINTEDKLIAFNLDNVKTFYYDENLDKTMVIFSSDCQIEYDTKNTFDYLTDLLRKI